MAFSYGSDFIANSTPIKFCGNNDFYISTGDLNKGQAASKPQNEAPEIQAYYQVSTKANKMHLKISFWRLTK